ncbi:MAG: hypothetical protein KID00_16260 [Clostridium argentinense]|uniref:Uncharacterized protein n=1 Tax=Clostridium faecium TaxID=2762223 RepID=A0ABR8YRG0_9CLOT|nr:MULTISPECIES: hypothetical protein [Clostridium]MBD8046598.1 hypothetical protein [Clostridium faecium]MBS5825370.1 hypothetical protein [Clostridium argentinense]MDU1350064.1 hypothetical protein [Clostridium argentinense]
MCGCGNENNPCIILLIIVILNQGNLLNTKHIEGKIAMILALFFILCRCNRGNFIGKFNSPCGTGFPVIKKCCC